MAWVRFFFVVLNVFSKTGVFLYRDVLNIYIFYNEQRKVKIISYDLFVLLIVHNKNENNKISQTKSVVHRRLSHRNIFINIICRKYKIFRLLRHKSDALPL